MLAPPDLTEIDAVVFDMDGTLIDSEGHYCQAYIHCMVSLGGSLEEEEYYQRFAGMTDDAIDECLQAELPDPVDLSTIRGTWRQEYERRRHAQGVSMMPGARELLDLLATHSMPLAVASAADLSEITVTLDLAGIRERFHSLSSGTEVPKTKPAPDVYLLAAERLGVKPTRCLAFEDTNSGTRAAIAAGLHTYMVPHRCEADRFIRKHAKGIANSLTEIVEALC